MTDRTSPATAGSAPIARTVALALLLGAMPALAGEYPCCSEAELEYSNGDVRLAGVVLEPYAEGVFPGAVIIQGSGDSDRSNGWARSIAETIAGEGFAVLLTDKRGSGRSGGDWRTSSFEDLAWDTLAGVEALRGREGVQGNLVGVVGLSQGGKVAPLAATLGRVDFVISMVSSVVPMKDALFHELENTYRQVGLGDAQIAELQLLTELSFRYIETDEDFDAYLAYRDRITRKYGERATRSWPTSTDDDYWTFWRLIHDYDPLPYWRTVVDQLGIPAFVAYGALDELDNVPVERSVERLRRGLEGKALTVRVYPGVGHSLRDDDGLLDALVADLSSWLERLAPRVDRSNGATAAAPAAAETPGDDADAEPPPAPTVVPALWTLAEGLCEPETVVHDRERGELYVSNICGFAANGEGYLSRVDLDGRMIEPRWIEGLDSPAGMALVGDLLYVADYRRVTVIDVIAGQVVYELPIEGAGALNDIAVTPARTIFVSDSARHLVWRVTPGDATPFPTGESFESANGLLLDERRLYVGGVHLWRVELATGAVSRIGPRALRDIDGVESDGDGGLVVSVVGGPVWKLPRRGEPTVWATEGLGSTNHLFLPERRLVVMPTGYDGTVVAFRLDRPRPGGG